jgi:hypothetical protein
MDFSRRTERRGGCVGDRRRGEEARDHQWGLMKGGRGGEAEGIKGGQTRLAWISAEGWSGGRDVSGTEEGENRANHQQWLI